MTLSPHETFFLVLAGLVLLFATATALGSWLTARTVDAVQLAWIAQLNSRIRASWTIVLLFAIGFAIGSGALMVLFAIASFFALREFVALTPIKASDHWALVVAFYVVIPIQYLLAAGGGYGFFTVFIPVYMFLLLPVLMVWKRDVENYLQRVAKMQWGLMFSVYCVSHAPAIAGLDLPGYQDRGPMLLLYFLLVLHLFELLSMIASASVGKTPLRSNPNKSREGVVLGGCGATVVGAGLWWMTPFTFVQSALMSAAIVIAAFMGAWVLNSVKRSLGAPDLARAAAEEGVVLSRGVLDRLDALTFAAPVFFHLTLYFFAL